MAEQAIGRGGNRDANLAFGGGGSTNGKQESVEFQKLKAEIRRLEAVIRGMRSDETHGKQSAERAPKETKIGPEPPALHLSLRHKKTGESVLYLDEQPTDDASLSRLLSAAGKRDARVFLAADKERPYTDVARLIDHLGSLGLHKISLNVEPRPQRH